MNKTLTAATLIACALTALAPVAALAGPDPDGDRATLMVKDSSITSSIKAQLKADPFKGLSEVRVETDDHGVVTLEGKVPSQEALDRALGIARGTEGVRTVKSELKVKKDD